MAPISEEMWEVVVEQGKHLEAVIDSVNEVIDSITHTGVVVVAD